MKKSSLSLSLIAGMIASLPLSVLASDSPIKGWMLRGADPKSYEIGIDKTITYNNKAAAYIKTIDKSPKGFGTLMQEFIPGNYVGKRVRLSAYIKTQDAGAAELWMRTDDYKDGHSAIGSFDNMLNRSIKGTTDWNKYEIVLDVNEDCKDIAMGIILTISGEAWISNINIEVVDRSVPVTLNLNKNKGKWGAYFYDEKTVGDYKAGIDSGNAYNGSMPYYIKSVNPKAKEYVSYGFSKYSDDYVGKRIRFTGYIKTQDIKDYARMYVYNNAEPVVEKGKLQNVILSYDDMANREIIGTTEWKKYSIVLDVEPNCKYIMFGIGMYGTGEMWIADPQIEVVDESVPVTDLQKHKEPVLLFQKQPVLEFTSN